MTDIIGYLDYCPYINKTRSGADQSLLLIFGYFIGGVIPKIFADPSVMFNEIFVYLIIRGRYNDKCRSVIYKGYIVVCFCFAILRLVYPVLPVSLDCSFLLAPSVFSNVYLQFLWIVHI
jgi:hypothetical protein